MFSVDSMHRLVAPPPTALNSADLTEIFGPGRPDPHKKIVSQNRENEKIVRVGSHPDEKNLKWESRVDDFFSQSRGRVQIRS